MYILLLNVDLINSINILSHKNQFVWIE